MAEPGHLQEFLPAAREALGHFPLRVDRLEPAALSENATFRVLAAGDEFALRLHRPGYNTLAELESERCWGEALHTAGLRIQKPLRARSGEHFVAVNVRGRTQRRFAGMTRWIPGVPLSTHLDADTAGERRRGIFRRIGRLAARIHNQSASWRPPRDFCRPRLDTDGLLGEQPRWGRFWEHPALSAQERELLLQARQLCRARLAAYGSHGANFSLIHADLHPDNIIVDDDDLGLIDFDDAAFGWHGYELASALVEYWGAGDFGALRSALLAGYRELRHLPRSAEAMLPTFLLIRGMAIMGWFHQRPEHAGSEFFQDMRQQVIRHCRLLVQTGEVHGHAPG